MYPLIKSFKSTQSRDMFLSYTMVPTFISIFVNNICANSKKENSYLYNNYVPIN